MILVATNRPFKGQGCHRWYQSHYGYNTSHTILFSKTRLRIRLDVHIRTIIVLTGGNLTGTYFLYLLSAIYFSVMTHLCQGKKVSILPLGDVNPRPNPSRWSLLEDSLYHAIGAVWKKRGKYKSEKNLTTIVSHLLFWATNFPSTYSATWFCNLLHLQTSSNNSTCLEPLFLSKKNKALWLTMLLI
jgi:hypothetical protein